jgi:hypothetical protein
VNEVRSRRGIRFGERPAAVPVCGAFTCRQTLSSSARIIVVAKLLLLKSLLASKSSFTRPFATPARIGAWKKLMAKAAAANTAVCDQGARSRVWLFNSCAACAVRTSATSRGFAVACHGGYLPTCTRNLLMQMVAGLHNEIGLI